MLRARKPSRYFNSSPEVIWLVVLMYVRLPLPLRNVRDLLFERGIDIRYKTVRLWWNRFVRCWPATFGVSGYREQRSATLAEWQVLST